MIHLEKLDYENFYEDHGTLRAGKTPQTFNLTEQPLGFAEVSDDDQF